MRTIKTILSIIPCIVLTFAIATPKKITLAETENYARVITDGVCIYQDFALLEPLFFVPIGYYLKVEEINSGTVKVSYGKGNYPTIFGYVRESELTFIDYIPTTPYVVIKVSTDVTDVLFNDLQLSTPYFNVPKNEILYYYGEIDAGDTVLCYVYYSKKLGFIDKTSLNPFTITENPDPLPSDEEVTQPEKENATSTASSSLGERLQIIIIVAISIVTISVVYFLFKPTNNKTDEEQNEFS